MEWGISVGLLQYIYGIHKYRGLIAGRGLSLLGQADESLISGDIRPQWPLISHHVRPCSPGFTDNTHRLPREIGSNL